MKILLTLLMSALFFIGCSDDEALKNAQAKLVVGNILANLELPDQHQKMKKLSKDTKYLIFSFSKPVGHMCNAFLQDKKPTYLQQFNALYIADVSPAPSIIKNMFILPDLEKLPFEILLINDDKLSAEFQKGIDTTKIVVATLDNFKIVKIDYFADAKALESFLSKN